MVAVKSTRPDFTVIYGGSVSVVRAETDEAEGWVAQHVDASGYQPEYPKTIYIERRYLEPLLEGINAAGLEVQAH